jgi:pullulanase/glycogen debranching enzyme
VADRVRMQTLGQSLVMLGQGVPFFQAGDELLRSKSLDGNSYNSGDWFNRLDYTYQTNNWGVGLPPNGTDRWDLMRPLLANPALRPAPADIQAALASFKELLSIRRSTGLFRLRTADEVIQRLKFYNTGPGQLPGLIVMSIENTGDGRLADPYDQVVVLFNASPDAQTFADAAFAGAALTLHPIQQESSDPVVRTASFKSDSGSFTVPGRTAAVFVVESTAPVVTATSTATSTSAAVASSTAAATNVATSTAAAPTPTATASLVPAVPPASSSTPLLITIIVIVVAAIGGGVYALRRRNISKSG